MLEAICHALSWKRSLHLISALRRQMEEVQQAQQEAAQVNFVTAALSACCTVGT